VNKKSTCLIVSVLILAAAGNPLSGGSRTWGGTGLQQANAAVVDSRGNTWIVGYTDARDWPTVNAPFTAGGGVDAFIVELDPSGNVLLSTCFGGAGDDRATAVGLDAAGNLYIAGTTSSSSLEGVPLTGYAADSDGFVVELDPTAHSILYARAIGGQLDDLIHGMVVGPDGSVWVAGETESPDLPVTGGAVQKTLNGPTNAFVAHLAPGGAIEYCTYLGGSGIDIAEAAAVDGSGAAWVVGSTTSADFPLSSPLQSRLLGGQEAFVVRLAPNGGSFLFSTYFGGSGGQEGLLEYAAAVTVDALGNAYVAGITSSGDFPVLNALQPQFLGWNSDAFLSSFAPVGTVRFSTYLGGSDFDMATSVALMADGRILLGGYTLSPDFPVTDAATAWHSGGYNGFFAALDPLATSILYATYVNWGVNDAVYAVAAAASPAVVGVTTPSNPPNTTLAAASMIALPAAVSLRFIAVPPCRVVDTRWASGPFGGPAIAGGASRSFTIPSGSCGIPSTAQAHSLNAAMIPQGKGWITLWPTGQTQPGTASVNSPDGRVKSSGVIVPAGTGGAISVYASPATVSTNVALDINGYFVPAATNPTALQFYPLTPCRVADTRNASGPLGGPYMSGGSTRVFPVFSASSCNVPTSTQAFSFNITVIPQASKMRWLTAWPSNESQPGVSTLNDPPGVTLSNGAIVPAPSDSSGDVSIYVTDDTHVVIDINGYFAAPGSGGLSLYTVAPCRVLDTRTTGSPFTGTLAVDVVDSGCGAPGTAQDYIFNATVVPESPHGYLTLWAHGQTMPVAANVTVSDGMNTGNMALVQTNNGSINAYFNNSTYLVLDLFGYFAP